MARSLTVKHEEKPSTTPLFTAFLLLACAWMAATALSAASADETVASPSLPSLIDGR